MASASVGEPSLLGRAWAVLQKRATYVWRQKKMPLFSWMLPPLLLSLLFLLEYVGLRVSGYDVEHFGDNVRYTFPEVVGRAQGFITADKEQAFLDERLQPLIDNPGEFFIRSLDADTDISASLLDVARDTLHKYVFSVHFGVQMTRKAGDVLWYNGQIQHTAPLVMRLYNTARLRNITSVDTAEFLFEVSSRGAEDRLVAEGVGLEQEQIRSQSTYRTVLPKVLRSIFFPLVSSLMTSNFVLFPTTERALRVKLLHVISGMGPLLYWISNFVFDFMFYMGTAMFVLPPLALIPYTPLTTEDFQVIFHLNLLHGYASLPMIYICSFLFDNPVSAYSTLVILTFIISSGGCLGSVFLEHYAEAVRSTGLTSILEVALQLLRLLPSHSYSRGMMKIIQLAGENTLCRGGGLELVSRCHTTDVESRLSLLRCCQHLETADPSQYVIQPLDVHPYSAYYEFVTLGVEGAILFVLLLCFERWVRRLDRSLSSLDPSAYRSDVFASKPAPSPVAQGLGGNKKSEKQMDSDVMMEDQLVEAIVNGQQPALNRQPALMILHRLYKAYGYVESNSVLQGLSFTVRTGECFGLLGVNGAGKTTTFRLLTGELLPHWGDAFVVGFSIVRNMPQCRRYLGYCPQRDGLLDMLTGVETLALFGRLRGLPLTPQYLNALLYIFRLRDISDYLVGTYSAGNRRKLSLCISMMGLPRMILLDEPYAGISTTARKLIVNYISTLQRVTKISILLSSHSLSDVEFLCNRIAILDAGRLQCLGSLAQLKEKFGKGYTITVKTYPDKKQDFAYQREVADNVVKNFPQAELVHSYEGLLEFRMSRVRMLWSEMFSRMARTKQRFKLQDFFITDTSLEQIFLSVTRKEACDAAAAEAAAEAAAVQAPVIPQLNTVATTLGL